MSPEVSQQLQADLHGFVGDVRREEQESAIHAMHEMVKIDSHIANFAYEKGATWSEIRRRHWNQFTQAENSAEKEAKRRKHILVKWFDENLSALRPYIDSVHFDFSDEEPGAPGGLTGFGKPGSSDRQESETSPQKVEGGCRYTIPMIWSGLIFGGDRADGELANDLM